MIPIIDWKAISTSHDSKITSSLGTMFKCLLLYRVKQKGNPFILNMFPLFLGLINLILHQVSRKVIYTNASHSSYTASHKTKTGARFVLWVHAAEPQLGQPYPRA